MKAYKIDLSGFTGKLREVVSEAVQKKAFELGYQWGYSGKVILRYPEDTDIKMGRDGLMLRNPIVEGTVDISADDFLSLEITQGPVFKPFDKVLVRGSDSGVWKCDLFSNGFPDGDRFECVGAVWNQCIHYEGNEHLLGTNKEYK